MIGVRPLRASSASASPRRPNVQPTIAPAPFRNLRRSALIAPLRTFVLFLELLLAGQSARSGPHISGDLAQVPVPSAATATPDIDVRIAACEGAHALSQILGIAVFEMADLAQF